jgi:O-antigen/teichoic acid export membrane protein
MFRVLPRHILVTASAWVSRVVIAVVQLLVVRILIQSLGTQLYAVFALLYGLAGWYLLVDFGIGFSVQNSISERRRLGKDDSDLVLTAALLSFGLLAVEIGLLFLFRGPLGRWFLYQFNLSAADKGQLFFAAGLLLACIGAGTVSYRVWYGQQRGYLANLAPALGALGGLACVAFVSRISSEKRLLWSVVAFIAPNSLAAIAGLVTQLGTKRRLIWTAVVRENLRPISQRALQFWLFSLMAAGVLQVDYIVIARVLPIEQIIRYTIATRVFLFIGTIYSSALWSIWPVFTELTTVRDWRLVKHNLQLYIGGGTALVLVCTALLLAKMEVITRLLSPNHAIVIPSGLILLLGGYYLIRIWTDSFATVLQSMSDLKPLWVAVPVQAILSALLEWRFAVKWGPYGVALGLIASYLLTVSWWIPMKVARHMNAYEPETHAENIYLHSHV